MDITYLLKLNHFGGFCYWMDNIAKYLKQQKIGHEVSYKFVNFRGYMVESTISSPLIKPYHARRSENFQIFSMTKLMFEKRKQPLLDLIVISH